MAWIFAIIVSLSIITHVSATKCANNYQVERTGRDRSQCKLKIPGVDGAEDKVLAVPDCLTFDGWTDVKTQCKTVRVPGALCCHQRTDYEIVVDAFLLPSNLQKVLQYTKPEYKRAKTSLKWDYLDETWLKYSYDKTNGHFLEAMKIDEKKFDKLFAGDEAFDAIPDSQKKTHQVVVPNADIQSMLTISKQESSKQCVFEDRTDARKKVPVAAIKDKTLPYSAVGIISQPGGVCTGTIISPTLVVTACHCVFHDSKREFKEVNKIYFVPQWNNIKADRNAVKTYCTEGGYDDIYTVKSIFAPYRYVKHNTERKSKQYDIPYDICMIEVNIGSKKDGDPQPELTSFGVQGFAYYPDSTIKSWINDKKQAGLATNQNDITIGYPTKEVCKGKLYRKDDKLFNYGKIHGMIEGLVMAKRNVKEYQKEAVAERHVKAVQLQQRTIIDKKYRIINCQSGSPMLHYDAGKQQWFIIGTVSQKRATATTGEFADARYTRVEQSRVYSFRDIILIHDKIYTTKSALLNNLFQKNGIGMVIETSTLLTMKQLKKKKKTAHREYKNEYDFAHPLYTNQYDFAHGENKNEYDMGNNNNNYMMGTLVLLSTSAVILCCLCMVGIFGIFCGFIAGKKFNEYKDEDNIQIV